MAIKYPKVTIITVNYNGRKYLKTCFDSLNKLNYPKDKIEIIMVDNVSKDGSVDFTRKSYKKVKIILNGVNNYCKGLNLGIESAKGEFAALINSDVKVDKNWLIELIRVITKDEGIAAVGSKILTFEGKIQNAGHYELPNYYWGERGAGQDKNKWDRLIEVPSLCGAAVLHRKRCLEKIGFFDEDFIMYGEDVDLSFRLRKEGWKLIFVPTSVIYHKFHGSGSEELSRFYIERNRLLFLARHYPWKVSDSLLGDGYFTAARGIDGYGKIYSVLPDVISKLVKHHSGEHIKDLLSQLFSELKKLVNYENEVLMKEMKDKHDYLNRHLKDVESRDAQIVEKDRVINNLKKEIDKIRIEEAEINNSKEEITNLVKQLHQSKGKALIKEDEIAKKESQLKKLQEQAEDKDSVISRLQGELKHLDTAHRDAKDQLRIKEKENSRKDAEFTKLAEKLHHLDTAHRDAKDQLRIKEKENKMRESELNELRERLNHANKQFEATLKTADKELDRVSKYTGELISALTLKYNQLSEKDSQITGLNNQITQLNIEIEEHLNSLKAKEEILAEREKDLTTLKEELNNISTQLRHRMDEVLIKDGQLIERDTQISGLNNQITQLEREIEGHLNSLKTKEEILTEREKDLDSLREELNNISTQLRHRMDEVLIKDGQLSERDSQITELNNQITQLERDIEGHLNSLKTKEEILTEREKDLDSLREELNNISTQLRHRMDEVLIKDGQLIERDTQISGLNNQITQLEREIEEHLNSLKTKEEVLTEREKDLATLKEELNNISTHLRHRMDEVLIKDGQLIEKDTQINKLGKGLTQKEHELSEKHKELTGIYASEGFRFVLRPLWTAIWHSRIFFRSSIRKLSQLYWFFTSVIMTPIFLFLGLCFFFEYITWVALGPLLKRIAPKRKIRPINDRRISMVMPNYNGIDCLRECLPSIFSIEEFNDSQNEVLVVDDGSGDESVEFIKKNYPQARLIQNKRNKGFGFTCNRGIKAAKNEIIVLINNDIILTKDFLEPLIAHLRNKDVFVTTPKLYAWDKKTFVWGMHMGRFEEGYIKLWNEAETGNGDRVSQASPSIFAIGGAMVFRKSDFLWLGGFDSIYRPNCWEDIDLSYRAWKRGLKVLYEPKSLMYHKGRTTLTYERPKEIKNELLFTWKNITDFEILKNHLGLLPWNLYKNRMNFLKGFFWALNYLPQAIAHRLLDRRYTKTQDRKIFNHCMLYYRNFMRRGFRHLQDTEKRHVLIITPFMPYPLNAGGKIRIHTLAKLLCNKYDMTLLTLINHEEENSYIPELKKVFKEAYTVLPRTPVESRLFPQRYKYAYSQKLIDKFNEIQKNQPIDLIQIESNELLYLAEYIKHIPVVYTEHDSGILFFRKSYYKINDGTIVSNFLDYLKRVRSHAAAYRKLDRVILLSQEDEQILKPFFPNSDFSFIPTGVDFKHFAFIHPDRTIPEKIVYVGHYRHYPNEDAVIYFTEKIFPRIQRKIPGIEFLIVGSSPTEKIKRISERPNIRLISDVDDVSPYLRESGVFITPIRLSVGIKGKVLEAMATGIPVVSTETGASGIRAKNKKEILIAETPARFASAVAKLFRNKALYSSIANNARQLVENKYDWNIISQFLSQVYDETINFIESSLDRKETMFNRIIDLSNQIVQESVQKGRIDSGSECGPEELHIELSYRCDSKCVMCDLWDYHKRFSREASKELTLDEIKQFVEQSDYLKKIKTVLFSGGEPFLRKDLVEICGYFIKKFPNISVGVLTNGVNTKSIIETAMHILKRHKPKRFWIGSSLDGMGEVHDKIRGREGAFSCLEKTIKACKKKGIDITLTFTLSRDNFDQLIPAREFAESHGLEFYVQFAVPKEVRERSVFDFTPAQLTRIEADIRRIMQIESKDKDYEQILQNIKDDSYQSLVAKIYYLSNLVRYQRNPKRYFRKCIAGTRFAMISPFGDLYFCPGLKNGSIGNIREEKFDSLWTSTKAESVREFIDQELCDCWLVCIIFPVIDEMRESVKKRQIEEDISFVEILPKDGQEEGKDESFKDNGQLVRENIELNEQEYQSGKIDLESTPRGIGIGAHWSCDADCIFCIGGHPRFFNLNTYKQFFEKRLSWILHRAEFVNFCGFGELLLMPRCEEFLDYINQTLPFNNKIFTTNGVPLTKAISQRLTDGNYSLLVSLHASEKNLHRALTKTDSFDSIVKNIQNIVSTRKSINSPSLDLVFVANALNVQNLPEFVEFAHKLGVDKVTVNYMTIYSPGQLKLSCFFKQEITNRMFSDAQNIAAKFDLPLQLPPRFGSNGSDHLKCPDPWNYFYVETEGSILPCCYAGNHIGYLYRDNFHEIWNGDFYKGLRKSLIEDKSSGWCKYCYKNKTCNVNDIRSHISFRADLQQKILKGINLK